MTEKRKQENSPDHQNKRKKLSPKYSTLLFDIEGTTTSISFVTDILFPYARSHVREFLNDTFHLQDTQNLILRIAKKDQWVIDSDNSENSNNTNSNEKDNVDKIPEHSEIVKGRSNQINENLSQAINGNSKDLTSHGYDSIDTTKVDDYDDQSIILLEYIKNHKEESIQKIVQFVERLMDQDNKQAELKEIQGRIWKKGYEEGFLKGHVYSDVVPFWRTWIEQNGEIRIYSSGSVAAQKLLFKYSEEGDLLPMLKGHYDLIFPGSKYDENSYKLIANDLNLKPESILFLTDNLKEAIACKLAGMHCILSIRPGTLQLPENHGFLTIESFNELCDHVFE